ncbi:hypothetical protein HYDPIDRAFT_108831 [Hydnomerulius pinastri MD-312]|nr:hypothetical protein HYDPIDRAFT_108831 [Hydnomerulius pinastri MD-312]
MIESLPNSHSHSETISMGKGISMTLLHNEPWISRVEIGPNADQLRVPPHIHEAYDETFRVVQGKMKYTIDGITKIYTPEDGVISVPKGVLHSFESIPGVEAAFEKQRPWMTRRSSFFAMFSGRA